MEFQEKLLKEFMEKLAEELLEIFPFLEKLPTKEYTEKKLREFQEELPEEFQRSILGRIPKQKLSRISSEAHTIISTRTYGGICRGTVKFIPRRTPEKIL